MILAIYYPYYNSHLPKEHGVFFIKYCSVLLQALTIETDEDLLFAIYDLIQIRGASWEEGTAE